MRTVFCFEEMHMTWKAHSFSALKRIWGQFHDFENFDALKCDLAKTCCAWPEKSVLYNFHWKRTVFQFWRKFEASFTILRTLALKNQIWSKRAAHDLKSGFCIIFLESALFSPFEENFRPVSRFWELWRSKMQFGQNVLRMTWKERFVQFSWKAHCFPDLKRIWGQCAILRTLTLKNAIWPKRAAHDLKNGLWTIFLEAHCFSVLQRILGQFHDFENFDAQKRDLAKTCCAWPEKRTLYNFHGKRTVFSFWQEFPASVTILRNLTLQNAIWPKRAAHDLERAFCTIFMKSLLFSRIRVNFSPLERFFDLKR